jgi:ACS family D-galactonate transporter-like MFS transporter
MALLVIGMIICYAHRNALSVATPFMIQELNLSPTVMGILLSAFFWSYSLMQIPAGWIVDRFGVKRAYAFGFVIWSVATALTGFANGLIALASLRMLLGIGQSVAFPASARAVANWFQNKERGTVTGGYLAGVRYGQALIGVVGAYFLASSSWKLLMIQSPSRQRPRLNLPRFSQTSHC